MKSTILLAISLSLGFAGTSCQKCKTCKQTVTTDIQGENFGFPQTVVNNFEACGEELKTVDGQSVSTSSTAGEITTVVTTSTTCD